MSSSYWHSQMKKIADQSTSLKNRIDDYEGYVHKLMRLYSKLDDISSYVHNAGETLSSGGFTYGGSIPFNEDYTSGINNLDDCIEKLESIINNTNSKIVDMQSKKSELIKSYNAAESNYKKEKAKEEKDN